MSWRTGSAIFLEFWPILQSKIRDKDELIDFTSKLLKLFVEGDMDTWDIEDVHPDIRSAMKLAGMEISEPERYQGE
ncbi:hypothetical protein [Sessilibacter corallicola]|uniref:hypothetical protein n=1 Tax=Sessilibacter corallicola TaxID=2904075 RepID=UPI001E4EE7B5|nr:hypothetical protein [Sessilibacter corallicola]MCE2028692.1 hypothetical protein [Sessilibacter corallicola]